MTREEAIEIVKSAFSAWESEFRVPNEDWSEEHKALDMAIEALSADSVSREMYDTVCEGYNKLIHQLSAETSTNTSTNTSTDPSARPTGEWIPCSERLPMEVGNYLVTFKLGVIYPIEVCFYDGEQWEKMAYDKVLAWMELPEPYRDDTD